MIIHIDNVSEEWYIEFVQNIAREMTKTSGCPQWVTGVFYVIGKDPGISGKDLPDKMAAVLPIHSREEDSL